MFEERRDSDSYSQGFGAIDSTFGHVGGSLPGECS